MVAAASYFQQDTIAAVATAVGGPIAIIRMSGPGAEPTLRELTRGGALEARKLLRKPLCALDGRPLDDAMVVYFPGPDSFTGEDVVELHLHGGGFGVSAVLEDLMARGIRPALPGEFSFRAVRSGKLGLDQALAVADLIAAQNTGAVSLALDKLSGLQNRQLSSLAGGLRDLAALAEAGIDFSDQDLEEVRLSRLQEALTPIRETLSQLAATYTRGQRLQSGVSVTFVGLPNAGKSSFFNALLGEERSIVASSPGTTRDVIRERMSLPDARGAPGVTLLLKDTAGLRTSNDPVESQGIERSVQSARQADLVLFLFDVTGAIDAAQAQWAALCQAIPALAEKTLGIQTKADLLASNFPPPRPFPLAQWVPTSALTGSGITEAVQSITDYCARWTQRAPGELLLTREDHFRAADGARAHLERAAGASAHELFAADLRQALHSLAPLIGDTLPDDVLGRIFSSFCIGK